MGASVGFALWHGADFRMPAHRAQMFIIDEDCAQPLLYTPARLQPFMPEMRMMVLHCPPVPPSKCQQLIGHICAHVSGAPTSLDAFLR